MEYVREIKFRAWDEKKKVMRNVNGINFSTKSVQCEPKDGIDSNSEMYDPFLFVGKYKLMQYTGLKDKNGVEIYEGDVLRGWIDSHWHSGEDKFVEVVKYDEKTASYNFPAIEVRHGDLEVIGNIYENKQLKELINFGTTTK